MATDRMLPAAATLNSVCANTDDASRLRFHLVVPEESGGVLPAAVRDACGGATFFSWTLAEVEAEIARARGVPPTWARPAARVPRERDAARHPLAVNVPAWDADAKHSSAYNHVRFYLPALLRAARGVEWLLLLDDDVLVRDDVASLFEMRDALTRGEAKALAAGCEHWLIGAASGEPVSSSSIGYLGVPYFGFGVIDAARALEDAACRYPGEVECVPAGFFAFLERAAREIDVSATAGSFGARLARREREHARRPPPAGGAAFATALAEERAWNFGLTLVSTRAWTERGLTSKYEGWVDANARAQLWPSDSLAYGLGLPFLALRGEVQCFEDAPEDAREPLVAFEQGLGVIRWDAMLAAGKRARDLDDAFALHFNGNGKPWDAERCGADLSPPDAIFVEYAKLSPRLFEEHLRSLVTWNATACARRLYGGASVDGTPFDTYAEAYLWAESHYKYADPPTQSIYDCVQICDDLFPGPNGTLACPRSALELELIQDIFWRERAAASSARRFSPR